MRFRADSGFLIGLGAVIGLAFAKPEWGAGGGPLPVDLLRVAGVCLIFFNQGLGLSFAALRRGLGDWRQHACVQTGGYLLAPALAFLLLVAFGAVLPGADLRAGFLYLAILPTTITSAVVLTSSAGGDTAGALFNTTLSNLAGVFIVPGFCLLFFLDGAAGGSVDPLPVFVSVAMQIVLPLVLGQLSRPVLGAWVERRRKGLRAMNLGIICFIVYAAFCESLAGGVLEALPLSILSSAIVLTLLFLGLFSWAMWCYAGFFRLGRAARIAAFFCGSQKTLAAGLPLAVAVFGNVAGGPDVGLLILPLLVYHPAQLLLGGWLLSRFSVKGGTRD